MRMDEDASAGAGVRVGVYDRMGADGLNCIIANQLETYYEPYVFY